MGKAGTSQRDFWDRGRGGSGSGVYREVQRKKVLPEARKRSAKKKKGLGKEIASAFFNARTVAQARLSHKKSKSQSQSKESPTYRDSKVKRGGEAHHNTHGTQPKRGHNP